MIGLSLALKPRSGAGGGAVDPLPPLPPMGIDRAAPAPAPPPALPLEITGAMAAFSFRALSPSYTGPLVRLTRLSDNAQKDFSAVDGWLSIDDVAAWVGSGDARVQIWYDQSGNGNHLAVTEDWMRPHMVGGGWVHRAPNGRPWAVAYGIERMTCALATPITGTASSTLIAAFQVDPEYQSEDGINIVASTGDMRVLGVTGGVAWAFANEGSLVHSRRPGDLVTSAVAAFSNGHSINLTVNDQNVRSPGAYSSTGAQLHLGTDAWGRGLSGGVGEMVLYNRALNDTETRAIQVGHAQAWGWQPYVEEATITTGAVIGPVSPYVFGTNEHGTMEGNAFATASYDRAARSTFRRLGGMIMSTYNWTGNFDNSGVEWGNENGRNVASWLGLGADAAPGAVVERFHLNSRALGAKSLLQVPIVPFVAADADGVVSEAEAAPSSRWVPVVWTSAATASDPIDTSVCDMAQFVRRMVTRFGTAAQGGIHAYALDNEPGLHHVYTPRQQIGHVTAAGWLAKCVEAARTIKSIDPTAKVFGPVAFGVTDLLDLNGAPDWADYAGDYGSFIEVFLDTMKVASDAEGVRLLDALDVHVYPQVWDADSIWQSADPNDEERLLQHIRTWTDAGYDEDSWVSQTVMAGDTGLSRPLLPSLHRLIDQWFPGTAIAIDEHQHGAADGYIAGLATVETLGRFSTSGVAYANHWSDALDWAGEAFRLFRDGIGVAEAVETISSNPWAVSAFMFRAEGGDRLVLVNKAGFDAHVTLPDGFVPAAASGWDGERLMFQSCPVDVEAGRLVMPPRSVRVVAAG